MTVNKRKKHSRYRGSHTHGKGSKKKRRGKGNKGGSGKAGTGKRAHTKKPSIWNTEYFGKKGFFSISRNEEKTINIIDLELRGERLCKKENDAYTINLKEAGYDKLLGKGRATRKYRIIGRASANAAEKIKEAGGEVTGESKVKAEKAESKTHADAKGK